MKSPGKRTKGTIKIINRGHWENTVKSCVSYLALLKDVNGLPLLQHRRKTFVSGLIITATSTEKLSNVLLNQSINPFSYVLTYKYSQDHLELLNSCIRGKNGFNNNPDIRQFKSALKKILLRASVVSSKYSNCMFFEEDVSSPVFSLKWTKNRSSIGEFSELEAENIPPFVHTHSSENKKNILAYIGGYIVKKLQRTIDCNSCYNAMLSSNKSYFNLSLIQQKDRGGLIYPSNDVVTILSVAERVFKYYVVGADNLNPSISSCKNLQLKLISTVLLELSDKLIFSELFRHDIDNHHDISEDFHSTQITKAVIREFINLRLFRYGQEY